MGDTRSLDYCPSEVQKDLRCRTSGLLSQSVRVESLGLGAFWFRARGFFVRA